MSDWEDEPKTGRGFGDQPAKTEKEVSGWSDDEGNDNKNGGGGERGGYRRGGENSDLNLATDLPPIPPIGCSKDALDDFLASLELDKINMALDEVRELRDYLFTVFKELVTSEWINIESLDQEERVRNVQKIRAVAANMDSLNMDVSRFLGETEMGAAQQRAVFAQLTLMGINRDENGPSLDTDDIVIPQATMSRRSRKANRTAGRALDNIKSIRDIYEKGRRQSGVAARISQENYTEVPASRMPQTYGSSRFAQNLSEDLLNCHKMKEVKNVEIIKLQLSSSVSWPTAMPSVWSVYQRSYHNIRYFTELPMKPTRKPPQTGNGAPDNTSGIQTSRQINVARRDRSNNQDLETPDATRDEEAAGGNTGIVAAEPASWSSTPGIKRHSELGLSLPSKLNLSQRSDGELTSTPAGAPSMPAEFPLGPAADSGTVITCDNEETAIVGAAAPSFFEVASGRPGRGIPASTPLHSFRPLLPVINEEHQPRMLELTINSPTSGGAPLAEPPAILPSSGRQDRDWNLIFRTREEIINYSEGSAMPRGGTLRRRRRQRQRRARIPATDANNVETPQDRIQGEEQLVATISSREFMANLLQRAAEAVSSSPQKLIDSGLAASASTTITKSFKNPGLGQMEPREIERNNQTAEPSVFKSQTNDELIFQQPRCHLEGTTMVDATKEVLQPSLELETLAVPPDLETGINISAIEPMEIDNAGAQGAPSITSLANIGLQEDPLANLGSHAIVTDVQIIRGPTSMTTSSRNLPDDTSKLSKEVELENSRAENPLYNRESVEDLSYIMQHEDMLRLNIDRQKELSLTTEGPESPSNRSMPAVQVYDPKIVVNIPEAKIRLVHNVLRAIITQPQVDMQNVDFVRNRMDAAKTFRILLELKAAGIINLSEDGRVFSLK